jgi:hypothetical protein
MKISLLQTGSHPYIYRYWNEEWDVHIYAACPSRPHLIEEDCSHASKGSLQHYLNVQVASRRIPSLRGIARIRVLAAARSLGTSPRHSTQYVRRCTGR